MLLLRRHLRRAIIIQKHPSLPTLPHFSSSQTTPTRRPPRKGGQAVRRLLKLIPTSSPPPHAPDPVLSQALDALKVSPHTLSANSAAALISAAADPLLAFDFYRFLKSSEPLFRPDSSLYASLLGTQLRSRSPHRFRIGFYLDEMRRRRLSLSPPEFRSLLAPLLPDNPELARSFLDRLIESLGPDSGIYAEAVSLLAENGLVDEAIRISSRARVELGSPELPFYSSLMGLYKVTGNAKAAMEAFLEMEEKGVSADEGIYRVLLRTLCRTWWTKLSWVVLDEMTKNAGFRPGEDLGFDLMRGFLKQGMVSEAGSLLRNGILKEKESFLAFATAMAEKSMPLEAFELLRTASKPELYASVLIGECGKLGLIEEAEKIFTEIKSRVENVESVYPSMIYVYSKAGLRRSAEAVWEEMEAIGGFSREACLHLMAMYGETGLLDNALKVFDKWNQSGVPNAEGYAVLIKALINAGKISEARRRLSEMRSRGFPPNSSSYSLVMEGYLRVGLLNHAEALLEECEMLGVGIEDGVIASSVAQILIKSGRYTELGRYLDGFERRGFKFTREKGEVLMQWCMDQTCLRKISCLIE